MSNAFYADPYPAYARLRAEHPVYWCEPWRGWIVTRHADVMAMLHAPDRYSNRAPDAASGAAAGREHSWAEPERHHVENAGAQQSNRWSLG